jgi:Methyltransferase domain
VESTIKKLGLDNITLVNATFENVARSWDKELDILHIGGLQTYEAVRRDYESWVKFVKPTGVILLHDTCVDSFGARRLFDQIDLPKANFVHSNGLGVLSQDRELIREIVAKFEALIEGSELRRAIASATAKERGSDNTIANDTAKEPGSGNTRASAWYTILSALKRPGRIARFVGFGKRTVDRVRARKGP